MEVLKPEEGDEVLVITRSKDRESFETRVGSEEFGTRGALTAPSLTVTAVK